MDYNLILIKDGYENFRSEWIQSSLKFEELITPYLHQNSFDRDQVRFGVRGKLKPFMCFDYVAIYHTKVKFNNIKNFRIDWR